jgi:ABC-type multidrug transport system fused ATPase/permease subunit
MTMTTKVNALAVKETMRLLLLTYVLLLRSGNVFVVFGFTIGPIQPAKNAPSGRHHETATAVRSTSVAQPPVITIDNLSCSHDGGNIYQLKDVSYVLPRGAKVGLVGRNGSGS